MKPSGVLFDFDGVIVDSLPFHLKAWDAAFNKIFKRPLSEEMKSCLIGKSTKSISEYLCNKERSLESVSSLIELKTQLVEQYALSIKPLNGVFDLLNEIKKLKIPFGIASNASRKFIESCLINLKIDIPIFLGIEDYRNPKPSPEPYLLCARKLNIPITDHSYVYVFEDSTHGLKAAVSAGMFPIGVTTQNDEAALIRAGARLICKDLSQALEKGWLVTIPEIIS
ncbi:MAG: HAD family phosphatase [Oligoflexales bacterium]|nr:HAD family phosphatase [Oligoflexales bacterium]